MKRNNRSLGNNFEKIACTYLLKNGYEFIAANVYIGHKEIDFIFKKDGVIHFIEVKGKSSKKIGNIRNAMTKRKSHHLIFAAKYWMQIHGLSDEQYYIDFIGVNRISAKIELDFLPNAVNLI